MAHCESLRSRAWCAIRGAIVFWIFGGLRWLETVAFPPARPSSMPANAVWIEGAGLPISWHHGSWLGCASDDSQHTTTCTMMSHTAPLNGGDGLYHLVYEGLYLSCRSGEWVAASDLKLEAPPDTPEMYMYRPSFSYPNPAAPIVFLTDGDVLVPPDLLLTAPKLQHGES